jgi:AcrR family transcriptional regulator
LSSEPPIATRRRGTPAVGPERVTSVDAVLEMAGRIADEEGLAALSMRRLGKELGVSSMTVYGYVSSKEELLDALAARVIGNLGELGEEPAARGWEEQFASVAIELRRLLRRHPGIAEIVLDRPAPALDRFRERMLAILSEAGFALEDAIDLLILTSCYALGYAHSEMVRASTDPAEEAERLGRLPARDFPHLAAVAERYARPLRDDTFEIGLRSLIDGFAARRLHRPNPGGQT